MKTRSIIVAIIAVATILIIGCKKDPLFDTTEITTKQVTSLTGRAAVSGGEITSDGTPTISKRGVCYSISHKPTINDRIALDSNTGIGSYSVTLTDLSETTTYYVRAFAWNSTGVIYGNEIFFTTSTTATIITFDPSNVSYTSVTLGGSITNVKGATTTERGVCWNTSTNPTISDSKKVLAVGTDAGTFTANITGLSDGVTYYVRAYATNSAGTEYGEEKTFTTTKITTPTITTSTASNVSYTSVTLGGSVSDANGATVTERGVCWSTKTYPTILNSKKAVGTGVGTFTANITGLSDGVTYYVRAYATNSAGTSYGEQQKITLKKIPVGCIPFEFSVSENQKVVFSMGNLQYQASTKTWRFAEHQYDMIGDANEKISSTYSGWIDLFGWGTSGFNGKTPYMTSTNDSDYGKGTKDIAGTNYDWGMYNQISNGGNQTGLWRTLTYSEWSYLLYYRTNAAALYGTATVNGVYGCIFLPDNWTTPTGVTFKCGAFRYSSNTYTVSEWAKMEANGAVFLPAADYRYNTSMVSIVSSGHYHSSSANGSDGNHTLFFYSDEVHTSGSYRAYGYSVRLVRDAE